MWTGSHSSDLTQSNTNITITQHLNDLCVASFKAWCYCAILQLRNCLQIREAKLLSQSQIQATKQRHKNVFCIFLSSSTLTLDILLMALMF